MSINNLIFLSFVLPMYVSNVPLLLSFTNYVFTYEVLLAVTVTGRLAVHSAC